MEQNGAPQGPGVVIGPGQHQARHQILHHQQEIGDVLPHYGELPHMEQSEQQTTHHIGHRPAFAFQIAEYQPAKQHFLHEGSQENYNQQRYSGGVMDLGGDGGVIQIGVVVHQHPGQPVD